MYDGAVRVAERNGISQRRTRQVRGHPVGDRIADDPSGEAVLDRAEVELVLIGPVLGGGTSLHVVLGGMSVKQSVGLLRGELPPDQVVMDRWPGSAMWSAFLGERREDPLLRTQPVDAVFAGDDAVGG